MRTRLFHTVVLVGTAMGASLTTVSCGGSESSGSCQGQSCETFPGISYDGGGNWDTIAGDAAALDSHLKDSGSGDGRWDTIADTWPGIRPADCDADPFLPDCAKDSGVDGADSDTFPGIAVDTGTDTWPGISPAEAASG